MPLFNKQKSRMPHWAMMVKGKFMTGGRALNAGEFYGGFRDDSGGCFDGGVGGVGGVGDGFDGRADGSSDGGVGGCVDGLSDTEIYDTSIGMQLSHPVELYFAVMGNRI